MDCAIRLTGIHKTYRPGILRRNVTALRGLDLTIRPGRVHALVGPNGAGKTTAFRILLGLVRADAGTGEILGFPLGDERARSRLGFLPESPSYYPFLTVRELLILAGRLSRVSDVRPAVDRVLERFDLLTLRDRPLRRLSKGQLQRVALAQASVHEPDLLILDEPMSGLDPMRRAQVRDWIRSLRVSGRTVLLASHVLSDVEALADAVGFLRDGRIVAEGTAEELLQGSEQEVEVKFVFPGDPMRFARDLDVCLEEYPGLWSARFATGDDLQVSAFTARLLAGGGILRSIDRHRRSLESHYFRCMEAVGQPGVGRHAVAGDPDRVKRSGS